MKDNLIIALVAALLGFVGAEKYNEMLEANKCKCPPGRCVNCDCGNCVAPEGKAPDVKIKPRISFNEPLPENAGWEPVAEGAEDTVPIPNGHLTLFHGSDTRYISWFQNHEGLKRFAKSTNYNVISWHDQRFGRYGINKLPAVMLQDADGKVIYAAAGTKFPNTPDKMYEEMAFQVENCPWIKPKPQPDPTPPPAPPKISDAIEEDPEVEPEPSGLPLDLTTALLMIASGGGAGYLSTRKDQ